jgi:hypothetical protein
MSNQTTTTTTNKSPIIRGSRIEFNGRVGTFISYCWDISYKVDRENPSNRMGIRVVDDAWKVVFDDQPTTFVRIADEDKPSVRNISPAAADVSKFGQRTYTVEMPDGTHTVVKKGAYWFNVAPGAPMPGKKDFSGGSNSRADAIRSVFSSWAGKVEKQTSARSTAVKAHIPTPAFPFVVGQRVSSAFGKATVIKAERAGWIEIICDDGTDVTGEEFDASEFNPA